MEISIQSIHFDADKKLVKFAEDKVDKLSVVFDRIIAIEVFLKFESAHGQIKEKSAELKVNIPGATLFSKENSKTFEDAIDKAVGSMKKQLKKRKEKIRKL